MTNGKVVQVSSADGTKPYGLFFSYPVERFTASEKPEVRFMETAKGAPAAIKTWWYPGERTGYLFVYPKDQARRLAQGATLPVLTTQAQTTTADQTNTPALARVSSTGQDTNVSADAKPTPETPTGTVQEGIVASSSIAIPNASAPASIQTVGGKADKRSSESGTRTARTRLPKTASNQPVFGMVGVLALLGATSLYVWQNRTPHTR